MRRAEQGFTLIELLVVLTVMGLLATLALSSLSTRSAFVDRARLRSGLAEALSAARAGAKTSGQPVRVDLARLDAGGISYTPLVGQADAPIVYPDGTTSGGVLTQGDRALVAIDWMTGRISDAPR
jgi:prepilin-type N-terminal cleavage/methylation domain-containing protein